MLSRLCKIIYYYTVFLVNFESEWTHRTHATDTIHPQQTLATTSHCETRRASLSFCYLMDVRTPVPNRSCWRATHSHADSTRVDQWYCNVKLEGRVCLFVMWWTFIQGQPMVVTDIAACVDRSFRFFITKFLIKYYSFLHLWFAILSKLCIIILFSDEIWEWVNASHACDAQRTTTPNSPHRLMVSQTHS